MIVRFLPGDQHAVGCDVLNLWFLRNTRKLCGRRCSRNWFVKKVTSSAKQEREVNS